MSIGAESDFLWTSLGLIDPLAARVCGRLPRGGVTGISIDTRTLREGELFFAIKGFDSDGHDYVGAASKKVPLRRWSMKPMPMRFDRSVRSMS